LKTLKPKIIKEKIPIHKKSKVKVRKKEMV
jgi:hypothetical protein